MSQAYLQDEDRLSALNSSGLLDTPPEEVFNRLTRLVCRLLGVPVALVSLVDAERQFFKSAEGLPEPWATLRQTPLTHSFCRHVVTTGAPLLIENAPQHPLVCDNLAVSELGVVAYLGMPLATPNGHILGSLCAIDTKPHRWTANDAAALRDLAAVAISEIALRHLSHAVFEKLPDGAALDVDASQPEQDQRLEALGRVAGGVAHDFANVLTAMQGCTRLALQHLDRDTDSVRRLLQAANDAGRRGTAITRRLLAFVGRGEFQSEPVSLSALLADLQESLPYTLEPPGPLIRVEVEPNLPAVLTNRSELEAVLLNLATNARDAMPAGGVLLLRAGVEAERSDHIPAGVTPDLSGYVCLAVADNGLGMDASTLARASEPFFTTKPSGKGTGLGLALTAKFAKQSGGWFSIESEPGRGTTVRIWLPRA